MTPATQQTDSHATEHPKAKRDFRKEVTDQIVQLLESGTAPWQKPWKAGALALPFNPTSQNSYRGGNAIHLMASAMKHGFDDPRWLTFKQALENGWQVRTGEKGTQIEYFEYPSRGRAIEKTDGETETPRDKEQRPIHRVYTVFNAQQIDGIPPYQRKEHPEWEVIHSGEQILKNCGVEIRHDQNDAAFYDRLNDRVHLPPKTAFEKSADYYGAALHEVAHSTGHPDRLNRQTLTNSYRFGDLNYAKEELRAELISVFLAAERGIPHDPSRHAAYVSSWIESLKNDKNEIFRAGRDANRAADFLLVLEREQSVQKALEAVQTQSRRDTVDQQQSNGRRPTDRTGVDEPSLSEAKALSAQALGENVRVYKARTDSGVYRGEIVGETQNHLVQKLSDRSTVAHPKDLLGALPTVGENVVLRYSNGKIAEMAPFEPKAKTKSLAR